MLRKRLIIVLTFLDGVLFRTRNFSPDYRYTHSFVDSWSIDEIVVLDISRSEESLRSVFLERVKEFARDCFVPLTVGGKVRSLEDIKELLHSGADKVILNSHALENPEFIDESVKVYGSQCITLSVDTKKIEGQYKVMKDNASQQTPLDFTDWILEVQRRGAGELMIQSYERDGTLEGYDLELVKICQENLEIPFVICSGAGNWNHFEKAFELGADGVCTTNIYHFTESSIRSAKSYLHSKKILVREVWNERR